uniref:Beta sliding clamp n=2 Tax=Acidithiobacillus sulfuriphilus TaxID=1867749 RepID=A0A3M8R328_9PROT|nr:DNA polymerase III subunit beta [Acidithiobacillus sulfuriphilus]
MKITIDREKILPMLGNMANITDRRPIQPILGNVLIQAEKEQCKFVATDLEVQLSASIGNPADQEGQCTVPGRKLFDICRALPEGSQIQIHKDGEKVTVRAGNARFTLHTLPAETFPYLSISKPACSGSCLAPALRSALNTAATAMAQNDARFFLNGILLEIQDNLLRCVSTDGHRLAMMEIPFDVLGDTPLYQGILPRKAVIELLRLLASNNGEATLMLAETSFVLEQDDLQFSCKLIDAKYPEYRRVIPENHPHLAEVDRQELKNALQQVSILTADKNPATRMTLKPEQMILRAHNEEQEDAEIGFPINFSGPTMEIAFNIHYLLDTTQIFAEETLTMRLRDGGSSAVFTSAGQDTPLYVVMPMRI